jgi:hypothetical protein
MFPSTKVCYTLNSRIGDLEVDMTRRRKDPLRPITLEEPASLEHISWATSEPASHVARAKALLAVAGGQSYT